MEVQPQVFLNSIIDKGYFSGSRSGHFNLGRMVKSHKQFCFYECSSVCRIFITSHSRMGGVEVQPQVFLNSIIDKGYFSGSRSVHFNLGRMVKSHIQLCLNLCSSVCWIFITSHSRMGGVEIQPQVLLNSIIDKGYISGSRSGHFNLGRMEKIEVSVDKRLAVEQCRYGWRSGCVICLPHERNRKSMDKVWYPSSSDDKE